MTVSDQIPDVHVRTRTSHVAPEASAAPDSGPNPACTRAISQEDRERPLFERTSWKNLASLHVIEFQKSLLSAWSSVRPTSRGRQAAGELARKVGRNLFPSWQPAVAVAGAALALILIHWLATAIR